MNLRRFEVIASYPFSTLPIGEVLIQYYFESSKIGMYCYVANVRSPLNGNSMKSEYVETMPHIFKEIVKIN